MDFLYPLQGDYPITQTFAQHKAKGSTWRGGIDWGCPNDTPVFAAQAGNLTVCGVDTTGYGMHCRIQHAGGYLTLYGHLRECVCCVGDSVVAGQLIGRSDNTGNSTGPHLHFELRLNNADIDPAPLLVDRLPPEDIEPETRLVVHATPYLNLRAKPTTASTVVYKLPDGTELTVTGERQGLWIPVQVTVTYAGWVHSDYVRTS